MNNPARYICNVLDRPSSFVRACFVNGWPHETKRVEISFAVCENETKRFPMQLLYANTTGTLCRVGKGTDFLVAIESVIILGEGRVMEGFS